MKSRRFEVAALLLVAVMSSVAGVRGQDFWRKKQYELWTMDECQKLLQDSPWAKRYPITEVLIESISNPSAVVGREQRPEINYQVQLSSALPIRQAMVRKAQIESKYDQMSAEQKKAFDAKAASFLGAKFPDTIVVHVAYSSNVQEYDRQLSYYWRTRTTELLKNFVYLIGPHSEKGQLERYVLGRGDAREFDMIFPRQVDGHPLLAPQDKNLKLEFQHPRIGILGDARILVEFKVAKMVVDGQVAY